ncbi:MAG: hypothetical protein ACRD3J_08630, partial [Thermoanaerobaculia bacterium]
MIRRFVLYTTGFTLLTIAGANRSSAQDTALVRAFRTSSAPFAIVDGRLKGSGADVLSRAIRENQFIMVGEDHGIREVPEFVGALFAAAQPAGYRHLAVEVGPVTSRRLETMMRSPTAQQDLNAFLGRYTPFTIPFFFWKEEAQMLEDVVKSVPSTRGVVWGLDQEFIMSSTYTFERLAQIAPTKAARELALQLAATSAKEDKSMLETRNPGAVWMVASTDADVAKLKAAFSTAPAGSEADETMRELLVSRDIYRMYNAGTNYESNQKRDDLMKQHFLA